MFIISHRLIVVLVSCCAFCNGLLLFLFLTFVLQGQSVDFYSSFAFLTGWLFFLFLSQQGMARDVAMPSENWLIVVFVFLLFFNFIILLGFCIGHVNIRSKSWVREQWFGFLSCHHLGEVVVDGYFWFWCFSVASSRKIGWLFCFFAQVDCSFHSFCWLLQGMASDSQPWLVSSCFSFSFFFFSSPRYVKHLGVSFLFSQE